VLGFPPLNTQVRPIKVHARLAAGVLVTCAGIAIAFSQVLPVSAGSSTGTLGFSAAIPASATVSSQTFAAFSYDPVGANKTTNLTNSSNSVVVTATLGTVPTSLILDQGLNATAGSTAAAPQRQLINGSNKLTYDIFSSAANQTIGTAAVNWGTANGPVLLVGTGSAQSYTLFVTIPAGQNLPAGTYTDTVGETVNF